MQTFTALDYLKIDLATTFGLSDLSWDDRLAWFEENESNLAALVADADEPACFLSGVMAYEDYKAGVPSGHLCGWDATASGLQLLSVLSRCVKSASACNLTPTGKRENAYKALYLRMQEKMPTLGDLPYKQLKLACMTHLYSSKAEPRKLFGEDTPELACFYETMDELLPGANELNYGLVALWDAQTTAHEWTLPDGFDVVVKVMDKVEDPVIFNGVEYIMVRKVNQPMKKGRSLGANIIHSCDALVVREMGRRCSYAPEAVARVRKDLASTVRGYGREVDFQLIRVLEAWRMSGFLSAVVIEYIDAQNAGHLSDEEKRAVLALLDSLPSKTFDLVMVHQWCT